MSLASSEVTKALSKIIARGFLIMSNFYTASSSTDTSKELSPERALEEISNLLRDVDKGELQELMGNEVRLNEIVGGLEEVKKIQVFREMTMASSRSLAEYNLNLQPKFEYGKKELIESHKNKEAIQKEFEMNKSKLESFSSSYSADTTLALLQAATAQAEDEAEQTVDMFLEGGLSVEEFIQKFQMEKTLHHMRRIKTEKLSELIKHRGPQSYSYGF